jgi:hypothetical protein
MFFGKYWLHMAIAAGVLALAGLIYYEGGRGPRAELKQREAEWKAAVAEREAEDYEDLAASIEYNREADQRRDERVETVNRTWAAIAAGLRDDGARARAAPKPVPVVARICNDPARDQQLSRAVDDYRAEVQGVIGELLAAARESRSEATRLLVACDLEVGDLIEVQAWASHQKQLWAD